MRLRIQNDYKSFFTNSYKTIRLSDAAPLTPELTDVAINNRCLANCSYCYTNALKSGTNFTNIVEKAEEIWGNLPLNDREFQIAIGGAGEPTLHPDFIPFIKKVRELEIIPNYTTNGMHLTNEILKATEKYCGGVALSWHPHISKIFQAAINQLSTINIKLNIHIIVGENEQSFIDLISLYQQYKNIVDYFVILPYQSFGRGKDINQESKYKIWFKVFQFISEQENKNKFAFGALFYDFLKDNNIPLEMSIYNPDIYSGYRILDNNYKKIFKSSYEITEKSIDRN